MAFEKFAEPVFDLTDKIDDINQMYWVDGAIELQVGDLLLF